MTFKQFLLILRARLGVIAIVFALTVSLVVGFTLSQPEKYTAESSVVIDVKSKDLISGATLQGLVSSSYLNTQVGIITSKRTAIKVVQMLKLNENPQIIDNWYLATEGQGDIMDWLASSLQRDLVVKTSRSSNIINLSFSSSKPQSAALMVNTFAKAYLDVSVELGVEPARKFSEFFKKQTLGARQELVFAQKALSDYLQDNSITSLDNRVSFEMMKLNDISSQLTRIQGVLTESQSKRGSQRSDTISEVIQNPLINELKIQASRLKVKLNESRTSLGLKHPQTISLKAEIATVEQQIKRETGRIVSSIETSYEVNRIREEFLKKALEAQKERVLELNKHRDQITLLQGEVQLAQRNFDAVSSRATQTSIEGQANQTNVSVLTEATVPTKPTEANLVIRLFIAVFLGTLLGIGMALITELIRRKVRCTDDLSIVTDVPVLGTVGSASRTIKAIRKGAQK